MYSEKPDDDFSQSQQEKESNQDKTAEGDEIENNSSNNNNNEIPRVKKNRTLQYYKFLFYSLKTEIKIYDFLKLLRNSNTAELTLWTVSVVLFANIPKDFPVLKEGETSKATYNGIFIWFHILHIIRAFLGMYLGYKLPRSYQIMDILQNLPEQKLSETLFNDLLRETLYKEVILPIKQKKLLILIYFASTILNAVIDLIDFLFLLTKISSSASSAKVVFLTYTFIAVVYLIIDFSYIFWLGQLRYIFPPEYLRPIIDLYNGIVEKARKTFKLEKPKTDIVSEVKVQKSDQPYVKSSGMNNGGYNILENVFKDSLGIYNVEDFGNSNKNLPPINNENNIDENIKDGAQNNNYPNSNEILN